MKNDWLITFRSVTFAQRGERALRERGVHCTLQRTPRTLSEKGCGYCLKLQGQEVPGAVEWLREQQIPYGKLYALSETGKMEERVL